MTNAEEHIDRRLYPLLGITSVPVIIIAVSAFLMPFGQELFSVIRVFTDTSGWTFSSDLAWN